MLNPNKLLKGMPKQELGQRAQTTAKEQAVETLTETLRPTTKKLPQPTVMFDYGEGDMFILDDIEFIVGRVTDDCVELSRKSECPTEVKVENDLVYLSNTPRIAVRFVSASGHSFFEVVPFIDGKEGAF